MKNTLELIYIHEGLCGWSYSFNDSLQDLMISLEGEATLRLIPATFSAEINKRQVQTLKDYCAENISNFNSNELKFSRKFIDKIQTNELNFCNSEMLTKAIISIQKFYPSRALESLIFFQKKIFIEAKNISDANSYLGWFYELGLDGEYLFYFMNGSMTEQIQQENNALISNLGITTFPMLLLKKNNRLHIVSKGYQPYEKLWQSISTILKPSVV